MMKMIDILVAVRENLFKAMSAKKLKAFELGGEAIYYRSFDSLLFECAEVLLERSLKVMSTEVTLHKSLHMKRMNKWTHERIRISWWFAFALV